MATAVNPFQLDDPNAILAGQNEQIQGDLASTNLTKRGEGLGNIFSRFIQGNPQVDKARTEYNANLAAQQGLAPQADGESDLDYAIRSSHAMYHAIAGIDPNKASQVLDHIASLQQAKVQQAHLTAETQGEVQTQTINRENLGTFHAVGPMGSDGQRTSYGVLNRFNQDGSVNDQFSDQKAAILAQHPDAEFPTEQALFQDRAALAHQKIQTNMLLALQKSQMTAFQTPEAADQGAMLGIVNTASLNRLTPAQRQQVYQNYADHGINIAIDGARARAEIAGVQAALTQAGRRDGTIAGLNASLDGMGKQVLATMQAVPETQFQGVNTAWNFLRRQTGNAPIAAYDGALQSFVSEYSRVLSGGGTMTSDAARAHATQLINAAQTHEQVEAAVKQLGGEEQRILKQAGDVTLETLALSQDGKPRYPTLAKISEKYGLPSDGVYTQHVGEFPNSPTKYVNGQSQAPSPVQAGTGNVTLTYDPATGSFK